MLYSRFFFGYLKKKDIKKLIYLFIFVYAGSSLLFGLSLVAVSGGYSLAGVCRLLIVVIFPVEHWL